jgi:hypothetical protein
MLRHSIAGRQNALTTNRQTSGLLSRHPLPTTEATWRSCTVDGDGSGSLTVWLVGLLAGRASECVDEQFALKTPDCGGFD